MKPRMYGPTLLSLSGLILMGIGLYFIFFRPPLLPEDARYIEVATDEVRVVAPGLLNWLQKVFWVMGGYIFTTGLLTLYIARTLLRQHIRSAVTTLAVAGITSIAWMVVVNFILDSDFKWLLLALALLWGVGLVLTHFEGRSAHARARHPLPEARS